MGQHVEDNASPIGFAVIPRGPLRGLQVTLEYPVAKLTAHGEDASEEARVLQHAELAQTRQIELVLHYSTLHAVLAGQAYQGKRFLQRFRERLLTVNVFSGLDRAAQQGNTHLSRAGVEEDRVLGIGKRGIEVFCDPLDAMA